MRFNHANGSAFSRIGSAVLSMLCLVASTSSGYSDVFLTASNATINAGQTGSVTVTWTSTQAISYLQTEFILTAVSGPSAGLSFTTSPTVPLPTWGGNYVFAGDSFQQDFYNNSTNPMNPAQVTTTNWTDDTFNYNDSTLSTNDFQQNGTRYWAVLNLTAAQGVSGTFQLTFGSSEFDHTATAGTPIALDNSHLSGGLINVISAVPEPSSGLLLAGLLAAGVLSRVSRKA